MPAIGIPGFVPWDKSMGSYFFATIHERLPTPRTSVEHFGSGGPLTSAGSAGSGGSLSKYARRGNHALVPLS